MATDQSTVTDKDIPGFPGYRVGDDGSVWTCRKRGGVRTRGMVGGRPWAQLKPNRVDNLGHRQVKLYSGAGMSSRSIAVHRLILLSFIGPCPDGMVCGHGDGNASNNARPNRRWDTPTANGADMRRHGSKKGERASNARLSTASVLAARREYAAGGVTLAELARRYGVHACTMQQVVSRRTWKHLP